MNILLVSPKYQETFWSMSNTLPLTGSKSNVLPLGLLTVAALLPEEWNLKLIDLNARELAQEQLEWADMLFISAMTIQSKSAEEIVKRANEAGVKVVAGGPHYTLAYKYFVKPNNDPQGVDHFFLGEAEEIIDEFLTDLGADSLKESYRATSFPDLANSPTPRYDLINPHDYQVLALQFSRGCPFACEFCDVAYFNGRAPRYKSVSASIAELDAMKATGFKGTVMFVDDNFIGNTKQAKTLLRAVISWQKNNGHPFIFLTQASINLADDPELMRLMAEALFFQVFIGIETPSSSALNEVAKKQNLNRDLIQAVRTIQAHGMEVMSGFIVGFDSDTPETFAVQRDFIEEAGIATAMVGMLIAPPETPLWKRLEKEGRILGHSSGNNALDFDALNFIPKMGKENLLTGYTALLADLYSPKASYARIERFLSVLIVPDYVPLRLPSSRDIKALFKIIYALGFKKRGRLWFWRLFFKTLFKHPQFLTQAMVSAAMVFHYQTITREFLKKKKHKDA